MKQEETNERMLAHVRQSFDWLVEQKVRDLLQMKGTSLWKLRKKGEVKSAKIGNKVYYSLSSIEALLERNKS